MVYTIFHTKVYTLVYSWLYTRVYTLVYTTFRDRDCTGPHARTYCTRLHATATAPYR